MKNVSRRAFLGSAGAISLSSLACRPSGGSAQARLHPLADISRPNIKITDVTATVLSYEIPDPKDYWTTDSYYTWKNDEILIEIATDKGIVGIGCSGQYGGVDRVPAYVEQQIKPFLVGKNPYDVSFLTVGGSDFMQAHGWAGIDAACWDIIGKHENKPVYELLAIDNKPEPRLRCYASYGVNWKFYDHPETLIEDGVRYKQEGWTAYKIRKGTNWKYSNMTIQKYVPFLEKLRAAVGDDMDLMQETMMTSGHTTDEVVAELCPVLDRLNFHWFEQPMGHWNFAVEDIPDYLKIKAAMKKCMVSGGESWLNRTQCMPFFEAGALDIIQTDCNVVGVTENWFITRMAHQRGIKFCPHNWHGGLTTMANAHVAAAAPNRHMLEINRSVNALREEIFVEPMRVEKGYLTVPAKPGFGMQLIPDVKKKFPYIPGNYTRPNPLMPKK